MGMDWIFLGELLHMCQKVFRSVGLPFYEMVVVVTKKVMFWYFIKNKMWRTSMTVVLLSSV
jgi:hypothetical protein